MDSSPKGHELIAADRGTASRGKRMSRRGQKRNLVPETFDSDTLVFCAEVSKKCTLGKLDHKEARRREKADRKQGYDNC